MKTKYFLLVFVAILTYIPFTFTQNARGNETSSVESVVDLISEEYIIAANDLSGRWRGDDGGIYYIRQVGNDIFWFGESSDQVSWTNVYHGYISGDRIIGSWADVPKGNVRQAGEMDLKIESSRRIVAIRKTGGFGGSIWTR